MVSLCDKARETCPGFPDHPRRVHWSIPNPATAGDTDYLAEHTETKNDARKGTCCHLYRLRRLEGDPAVTASQQYASVRYLVGDVPAAVDFYTTHLGFTAPRCLPSPTWCTNRCGCCCPGRPVPGPAPPPRTPPAVQHEST